MGVATAEDKERQRIAALRAKLTDSGDLTLAERFRVLFALRNYDAKQHPEAVEALMTGFEDPSALFRHEIAFVLGQMQAESAVPKLTQVLDDEAENSMVRHEAGEALGAIASKECELPLQKHLHSQLPEIHETCHLALERFKKVREAELNQEETGLESYYKSVDPAPPIETDEHGNVLTTDQLSEIMLSTKEDLVRRYGAMFSLRKKGSNGDPGAVIALCNGFQTDSALMRHELAYILGQLQDSNAVDTLIERLRDPQEHPMVRHEAAEALGAIGCEGTDSLLGEFLEDLEPIVADSCEVALDLWEYENSGDLDYVDTSTAAS